MNSLFASLTPRKRSLILLVIIYIGFISLGLPDTVLGVAWDTMRLELNQPVFQSLCKKLLLYRTHYNYLLYIYK